MGYKLSVFTLDLVQSDSLVFFTLTDLSKISSECLKAITLLALKLLSKLLVELVLLLEQLQLLSHLGGDLLSLLAVFFQVPDLHGQRAVPHHQHRLLV